MAESPITPRAQDFAAWYQDVVLQGDMAEPAEIVKGCMVIKANGYAVWEAAAARARRPLQSHRPPERVLPAADPAELSAKGSRARGRLLAGAGRGHHRRRQGTGRAVRDPPDVGDHHRPLLRQVDSELARPADAAQSVGQRDPLGAAHAHVPAHHGVPLAGRPHRALHARRGAGRSAAHARRLCRSGRRRHGDAGDQGREDAAPRSSRARCAATPSKP